MSIRMMKLVNLTPIMPAPVGSKTTVVEDITGGEDGGGKATLAGADIYPEGKKQDEHIECDIADAEIKANNIMVGHDSSKEEKKNDAAIDSTYNEKDKDNDYEEVKGIKESSVPTFKEMKIDELSPKTLGSYVKKAHDDSIEHSDNAAGGWGDSARDSERKLPKREKGIRTATDKLVKKATPDHRSESSDHWIKGAIKHPGALHKDLDVPQGEKIPTGKLDAAAKKGGKEGERARLAKNLRGLNHEGITLPMFKEMVTGLEESLGLRETPTMSIDRIVKEEYTKILDEANKKAPKIQKKLAEIHKELFKDYHKRVKIGSSYKESLERRIQLNTVAQMIDEPVNELMMYFLNCVKTNNEPQLIEYHMSHIYFRSH